MYLLNVGPSVLTMLKDIHAYQVLMGCQPPSPVRTRMIICMYALSSVVGDIQSSVKL